MRPARSTLPRLVVAALSGTALLLGSTGCGGPGRDRGAVDLIQSRKVAEENAGALSGGKRALSANSGVGTGP